MLDSLSGTWGGMEGGGLFSLSERKFVGVTKVYTTIREFEFTSYPIQIVLFLGLQPLAMITDFFFAPFRSPNYGISGYSTGARIQKIFNKFHLKFEKIYLYLKFMTSQLQSLS